MLTFTLNMQKQWCVRASSLANQSRGTQWLTAVTGSGLHFPRASFTKNGFKEAINMIPFLKTQLLSKKCEIHTKHFCCIPVTGWTSHFPHSTVSLWRDWQTKLVIQTWVLANISTNMNKVTLSLQGKLSICCQWWNSGFPVEIRIMENLYPTSS